LFAGVHLCSPCDGKAGLLFVVGCFIMLTIADVATWVARELVAALTSGASLLGTVLHALPQGLFRDFGEG